MFFSQHIFSRKKKSKLITAYKYWQHFMSLKPCLFCFYMATSLYSVFTVMYGMYHLRTYAVWLGTRELCSTDGRRQATVTIRRDNQGFIHTNQPPSRTGLHSLDSSARKLDSSARKLDSSARNWTVARALDSSARNWTVARGLHRAVGPP